MAYMPPRGGTRGGKDQFEWDEVKADKHRENYLGHSVMAPVGRWQKGKDLSWYNKKSKVMDQKEILKAEIAAVKRAEEDAMAVALGRKPKALASGSVSKQELAEACRRQSVEEKEEEGQEERMKGLGYMSHRLSHLHSNQAAPTGAALFESHPVHEAESSMVGGDKPQSPNPPTVHSPDLPPTKPSTKKSVLLKQALEAYRKNKEKKKKRKKDRSKKKRKKEHSGRRQRHTSTSDSEEESDQLQRKRGPESSSSSDVSGGKNGGRRKKRKTRHTTSSDSEERNDSRRRRRERKTDEERGGERRKKRERGDRKEAGSESDESGAGSRRTRHSHGRDEKRTRTQQSRRHI